MNIWVIIVKLTHKLLIKHDIKENQNIKGVILYNHTEEFKDEINSILFDIRIVTEKAKGDDVPVFKIKINYKSGNSHVFWANEFNASGGTYTWSSIDPHNEPLLLGTDNIESIFQIGVSFIDKDVFEEFSKSDE